MDSSNILEEPPEGVLAGENVPTENDKDEMLDKNLDAVKSAMRKMGYDDKLTKEQFENKARDIAEGL